MTTFTAKTTVTAQMIADQVITAFEGGITYWAAKARPVEPCEDCVSYEDKCPWYARPALYEGPFKIRIVQQEEHKLGAGTDVFLTNESVQKGLDVMAEKYPEQLANIVTENGDADTADTFIQCAVFGDLVYG